MVAWWAWTVWFRGRRSRSWRGGGRLRGGVGGEDETEEGNIGIRGEGDDGVTTCFDEGRLDALDVDVERLAIAQRQEVVLVRE